MVLSRSLFAHKLDKESHRIQQYLYAMFPLSCLELCTSSIYLAVMPFYVPYPTREPCSDFLITLATKHRRKYELTKRSLRQLFRSPPYHRNPHRSYFKSADTRRTSILKHFLYSTLTVPTTTAPSPPLEPNLRRGIRIHSRLQTLLLSNPSTPIPSTPSALGHHTRKRVKQKIRQSRAQPHCRRPPQRRTRC